MEAVEFIITFVQELGFPIACVAVLFMLLYREMQDRHDRDTKFTELLERNTAAINSLEALVRNLHAEDNQ